VRRIVAWPVVSRLKTSYVQLLIAVRLSHLYNCCAYFFEKPARSAAGEDKMCTTSQYLLTGRHLVRVFGGHTKSGSQDRVAPKKATHLLQHT
jgi:hypothetical protein